MNPIGNITTELLPTHTPALFKLAVGRSADLLKAGRLVVLPTETVYGLAANALDPVAVARIFEAKGRPANNPVIVHVHGVAMAKSCAANWPELAEKLARAFWPGPLTLVLEKAPGIPGIVTAGGSTVGVRWPSHPFIQQVIEACGFPLAAPSANRSGEVSPTNADHALRSLNQRVELVVDGGQCQVGIESTVVDLSCDPPKILRPGMIHEESILAVTGRLGGSGAGGQGILRSPGLLEKHYAPKAKVLIWDWDDETEMLIRMKQLGVDAGRAFWITHSAIPRSLPAGRVCVIPHDPEAYARALYSEFHRCDAEGAGWIIVESVPGGPEWIGIADRLRRAAA